VNNSNGDYAVTWDIDFASANYAVLLSTLDPTDNGAIIDLGYVREDLTAGGLRVRTVRNDALDFTDVAFFIAAFGR
jgi:hypothetical protein